MIFTQSNRSRRRSGIALIIVLLVITVLAILAGGFAYSMKVETQLARNASFDDDLFWVAWAGLEAAKYELALDLQGPCAQFDSLKDSWAGGPGCDETGEALPPPEHRLEFEAGKFATWKTIDAERKFNINIAGQPILQQAMTLIGLDPASHSTVMDSIADWIDTDSDPKTSGAENDFYQSGQGPYGTPHNAKNGPIDDISELLMINGVTRGIFEGSGGIGTGVPLTTSAARSRFDEPIYSVGLRDLFCTVSSRTLNVNTASETTLQLLPPVDANVVPMIIQRRAGPDGIDGTLDDTPFRNPQEFLSVLPQMPANMSAEIMPYIGVRSVVFEITVEAHIGGQHRTYVGLVARNNIRDIAVLAFAPKWE